MSRILYKLNIDLNSCMLLNYYMCPKGVPMHSFPKCRPLERDEITELHQHENQIPKG